MITIYHKPSCSKSTEALRLLEKKNAELEIIEYLENPPTRKELAELLKKLGLKAEELVRKKEKLFQEKFEGKNFSEMEWIELMVKNPVLIERPIIVKGEKAIIGRPAERVEEFLNQS